MSDSVTSPRTDDEPMAFTRDEAFLGARWSWMVFVILLLVATPACLVSFMITNGQDPWRTVIASAGILLLVLIVTAVIGGVLSLFVVLLGLPLVIYIGRALRRQRSVGVHLAVYGFAGAMIGAAILALFSLMTSSAYVFTTPIAPLLVAMTSLSVMAGWWRASRPARRALCR